MFKITSLYDVDLYMKSGNVIKLKRLKSFTYSPTQVKWESTMLSNKLIDVRPDEIEAVVQVRTYKKLSW